MGRAARPAENGRTPPRMQLDGEDRALLADLAAAKQEATAAVERFERLRLLAFQRGVHIAAVARATGDSYDAVRMARSRARL